MTISTADERLNDKLAELSDVVRAADDVLEAVRLLGDYDLTKAAEALQANLSSAETCETEGDFDRNLQEAQASAQALQALLKSCKEEGIEDARDAMKTYRQEFSEFQGRL